MDPLSTVVTFQNQSFHCITLLIRFIHAVKSKAFPSKLIKINVIKVTIFAQICLIRFWSRSSFLGWDFCFQFQPWINSQAVCVYLFLCHCYTCSLSSHFARPKQAKMVRISNYHSNLTVSSFSAHPFLFQYIFPHHGPSKLYTMSHVESSCVV